MSLSQPLSGPWVIADACFDPDTGRLHGRIELKRDLRVVVFGHTPPSWRLSAPATFRASCNDLGGWQAEVVTADTSTLFEIEFERN